MSILHVNTARQTPLRPAWPVLILGLAGLIAFFSVSMLHAEPLTRPEETPSAQAPSTGASTPAAITAKTWLNLQASGQYASPIRQTLSGEALDRIHRKFLNQLSATDTSNKSAGNASKGSAASDGAQSTK